MGDQAKNIMIGLFVLTASAIIIFILLFLHPSVGDEKRVLRVRFSNIDKVTIGTRVTFAGKPVGEIVSIDEIEEAILHRKAIDGIVYVYELKLRVDSSVNVYNSDEISLKTSGLLGEKSVSIDPHPPKPGQKLHLVNDEIIYAVETGSVEDTLKEFKEIGIKIESVLDALSENFAEIKAQRLWENVGKSAKNISEITSALNQPENLSDTVANIHDLSKRILSSWDAVDDSIKNIDFITTRIKNGEGTAGKFLVGDEIYLKVDSILNKGSMIMNDVNHYGLLFHLDKGWQRLRARRLNLLNKLSTPQEFRNYFNDEMDTISTSLSRVSMLLERTDSDIACYEMLQNRDFARAYQELLKRVSDIEESLRMYNQQLQDTQCIQEGAPY